MSKLTYNAMLKEMNLYMTCVGVCMFCTGDYCTNMDMKLH